ncbi:MAG: response regulator [Polyangiaceae bacterium]|nr:response regulator [Polyangiaceae bacterium]
MSTTTADAPAPLGMTFEQFVLDVPRVNAVMDGAYERGDRMMKALILLHTGIALALAPIYGTWLLSISIALAAAAMFFCTVYLLPKHRITRVVAGVSLQVFVALHIYQLHGLAEMHFFFFTAFTAMVIYQDGLSMWPGTLLIIGQHIIFALLHNSGVQLYFFTDVYVSILKLFFHFGIAILHVALCGWWAVFLRRQTLLDAFQRQQLRASTEQLERDMAARVAAERALAAREAEARLGIVANHTSNGVVIADPKGRIEWVNAAFERLAGKSIEEAKGRSRADLLLDAAADRGDVERLLSQLEEGDEAAGEVLVHSSGKPLWLYLQWKRVRDEAKRVEHTISVELDVTARKQAEAEVVTARQRAEEASRAKGDFLATMSHEIRTPLNGIIGMSDMLGRSRLDGRQTEQLETLRTCADNLLALVNDVLDLSKIDAGRFELARQPFEPRLMVDDVLTVNAARAQAKNIELVAIVDRRVPDVVIGDMTRCRQALTNLVANAVKFTNKGEVVVRVGLADDVGAEEPVLRFSVRDTGIGVDESTQSRLFAPFTQADGSISRRFGGSGLGLAISKRLVEAMGGSIGFESKLGVGSHFYFQLPFKRGSSASPPVSLAGKKAWVESAHDGTRTALTELLAARGAHIECGVAADADVAIVDGRLPRAQLDALIRKLGTKKLVLLTDGNVPNVVAARASVGWPIRWGAVESAVARIVEPNGTVSRPAERGLAWKSAPGQRVLLVEDNPVNQVVAQSMLEDLGLDITLAEDGEKALELLERETFDLVFMDCQMPTLDGFEATRRWRHKEPAGKRTPIIALTAQAMAGDEQRCHEAGMDGYLSKPLERRSLVGTLERMLRGKAVATSPGDSKSAPVSRTSESDIREIESFLDAFRRDLGERAVEKLLVTFTTHMPGQIERLRVASRAAGPETKLPHEESLARVAHMLRGAARTVGLGDLGGRLDELESVSKSDVGRAQVIATEIEGRLEAVYRAMAARVSEASA